MATYASGQGDTLKFSEVKKAIFNNEVPKSLDKFWTGKLRYWLSGSVVMYIDKRYGRDILKKLLSFNNKTDLLSKLNISESEFLIGWKECIQGL